MPPDRVRIKPLNHRHDLGRRGKYSHRYEVAAGRGRRPSRSAPPPRGPPNEFLVATTVHGWFNQIVMDENRVPEETTSAPDPVPEQDTAAPPRRLTAVQARKRYGIRLVIFLALFCWFTYDGWHNPKFQKPEKRFDMWFNRIGAYILAAGSLYHGAMFVSAALTVKRQRETGEPDSSADGGPPSATT